MPFLQELGGGVPPSEGTWTRDGWAPINVCVHISKAGIKPKKY